MVGVFIDGVLGLWLLTKNMHNCWSIFKQNLQSAFTLHELGEILIEIDLFEVVAARNYCRKILIICVIYTQDALDARKLKCHHNVL